MKRFALLCSLLLMTTVAFAQVPSVAFGVHANITNANFPGPEINGSDALKDVYGTGFGGGAHLDVGAVGFSLRFSADYLSFSPDNDKYHAALEPYIGSAASQFTVSGGTISYWSISANGKMPVLPLPIITSREALALVLLTSETRRSSRTALRQKESPVFPRRAKPPSTSAQE